MSGSITDKAIQSQGHLVTEISELESLVDVCANNHQLQTACELSSVCEVLAVVADRLTTLKHFQSEKLEEMKLIQSESFDGQGGES